MTFPADPPFRLPKSYDDPAKEQLHQGVYRLARDGGLTLINADLSAPNGIAFAPAERSLYESNADARRLARMAYEVYSSGTLARAGCSSMERRLLRDGAARRTE